MTPVLALAALCGLVLGIGLWLVLVRLPPMRPVTLTQRIAPQLRAVDMQSRLLAATPANVTPFGPLERILRPLLADAVSWSHRFNPASAGLARRLAQAGKGQSTADFRAQQLLWAAGALGLSTVVTVLLAASGSVNVPLAVVIILSCAVLGFVGREYLLSADIKRREARMLAEFPSLAELMALAVSAGESTTGALERICRTASGELAGEFGLVLAETRAGKPLVEALQQFSNRTRLAPLARFVDGITVAVQRGTPLADVLRAQAQDVRDLAKRDLMESAGKKEIAMMVPLVFGVLPLTVLFAVYPGIALINLGF
ncbi:type II secretion system protein F [Arthrobacter sp. RIT-PI-e]|uniref:type II secretion system F family protein n=1 Tax=Arthrobacter sp. RIT-PI-e TaxID=1681197 RepID=UPI000676B052|nr:type II secretion system F family protein [Arthrobacter sp. RIT-PI-e]KNC19568.1 type II secretion system protein F [Arthrobacter sp. RIT-PI-e]